MAERVTTFEARLAEMDRRLSAMQAELVPDRRPRPRRRRPEPRTPVLGPPPARGRSGPLASVLEREAAAHHEGQAAAPPAAGHEPDAAHPAAPAAGDQPETAAHPAAADRLAAMAVLCSRLLASMRELLEGYESLVPRAAGQGQPGPGAASSQVSVIAGPFPDTAALREFERALSELPGVREVALRGYAGASRAIVDVRLGA